MKEIVTPFERFFQSHFWRYIADQFITVSDFCKLDNLHVVF